MALAEDQIKEIKNQLRAQIAHLPEEQKKQAEEQIESLSLEAVESLLKQQSSKQQDSPYRLIIKKEIEAVVIGENSSALAVLEINPLSKGHAIIIPKNPIKKQEEMPQEAFNLARAVSSSIIQKMKANSIAIETESKFGEVIIEVIPSYEKKVGKDSPRQRASPEELKSIAEKIKIIEKIEEEREVVKIEKSKEKPIVLKRRIP